MGRKGRFGKVSGEKRTRKERGKEIKREESKGPGGKGGSLSLCPQQVLSTLCERVDQAAFIRWVSTEQKSPMGRERPSRQKRSGPEPVGKAVEWTCSSQAEPALGLLQP